MDKALVLTKVDLKFVDLITKIWTEGTVDENPRPKYSDGTPAHTKFITDHFEKYEPHVTPITNLRRIAWKTGVRELLAIYQTQTNTLEGFQKHGCNWWSPWMNEEGNLNKAYSYGLESHPYEMNREIVEVEERKLNISLKDPVDVSVSPMLPAISEYRYFNLIERLPKRRYKMQDNRTGEIGFVSVNKFKDLASGGDILRDNGKGFEWLYIRKFYGIGYLGNYKSVNNFSDKELEVLKRKWISMLKRCYTREYESDYGDVWVHYRWHSFENFLRDIREIPQFHLARREEFEGWELDKDYYNSNFYSSETCVFLRSDENKSLKDFRIRAYNRNSGQVVYFPNLASFVQLYGVSQGNAFAVIKGERKHVHGWELKKEYSKNGKVLRKELSRNQLNELLKSLKESPYSRRHMMSFFSWSNQDKKMLVECAFMTMWSVRKDKGGEYILDLSLIQRSSDYATAGHINLVQYKAFQMMVAKHLGYKVGTFSRHVMNVHIYDRHWKSVEQILEAYDKQIEAYGEGVYTDTPPELVLNVPDGTNFYNITIDDFEMKNYNPIKHEPKLEFDLGI